MAESGCAAVSASLTPALSVEWWQCREALGSSERQGTPAGACLYREDTAGDQLPHSSLSEATALQNQDPGGGPALPLGGPGELHSVPCGSLLYREQGEAHSRWGWQDLSHSLLLDLIFSRANEGIKLFLGHSQSRMFPEAVLGESLHKLFEALSCTSGDQARARQFQGKP